MKPIDVTEVINGERYFTVAGFAAATNRSQSNVRFLMSYGNRIRKLKVVHIVDKPVIPYSELLEFPFTVSGRNSKTVYHYDAEGSMIEDTKYLPTYTM